MKRTILFLCTNICTITLFAQRYTGYGRGSDWGVASGSSNSFYSIIILVIAILLAIVAGVVKIQEIIKLSSGEYIKAVEEGCIRAVPNNSYTQPFQIIQIWKLKDFEKSFGTFKYNTESMFHRKLVSITCIKDAETTIILVRFDCDIDNFFNHSDKYRVAKVKNNSYMLCRK